MKCSIRQWLSLAIMAAATLFSTSGYATSPDVVLTVNPALPEVGNNFQTIQKAIDSFEGSHAKYTEIQISPGTYTENIQLEQTSSSANLQLRNYDTGDVNTSGANTLRGLQILGDKRPVFPSYQNGYEHAANSPRSQNYEITNNITADTWPVLVSLTWGSQPDTAIGAGLDLIKSIPYAITSNCPPAANSLSGKIAIVERGTAGCPSTVGAGFVTKAKLAQDAGAVAIIIANNAPGPLVSMGGVDPTVTIPGFSISQADSIALLNLLTIHGSAFEISIAPKGGLTNPSIGSNYATVTLSHPAGPDSNKKIQVKLSPPLAAADPAYAKGKTPQVVSQPDFADTRLGFGPGDKIILAESDILSGRRKVYEIASLAGNVITLTEAVDPSVIDITKLGTSLSFLPNVEIKPAAGFRPVFKAQNIGFSMTGVRFDTSSAIPFGQVSIGLAFFGVEAYLSNIIVMDSLSRSANGEAFVFNSSYVQIGDGYRNNPTNRRLASIGWASGPVVTNNSLLEGQILFVTALSNATGVVVSDASQLIVQSLGVFGMPGLYQPGSAAVTVSNGSQLTTLRLFTVADIFGAGVIMENSNVTCDSFRLERIYKPANGLLATNALQLLGNSSFIVPSYPLFDDGTPAISIRTSSVVKDCFDRTLPLVPPVTALPNVGIFVDNDALFITHKELNFSGNNVNYLTAKDNQFITPGWSATPGSVLNVSASGKLNSVYQTQMLTGNKVVVTVDPAEEFQHTGLYIRPDTVGKTFTLFDSNNSKHMIILTSGSIVGQGTKNAMQFNGCPGSFVTFRVLSPTSVVVLDSKGIRYKRKVVPASLLKQKKPSMNKNSKIKKTSPVYQHPKKRVA